VTRENTLIYHDAIPNKDTLPLDKLSMVKATPMAETISTDHGAIIGRDIFYRLVPISVHEASSVYSEKKAQLVWPQKKELKLKTRFKKKKIIIIIIINNRPDMSARSAIAWTRRSNRLSTVVVCVLSFLRFARTARRARL